MVLWVKNMGVLQDYTNKQYRSSYELYKYVYCTG